MMEKTPPFRVQAFGNYFLLERIAVGGMAEIFKAKQIGVRGFEKIVVIKRILNHLSEDPEFVQMFEDEAKIAAQLTQANIVQIFELGEFNGTLYITMEHVEGKNLRDVTRAVAARGLHLSIEQVVFIMTEVLKGLDYAHRKTNSSGAPLEIIHRDMSPQNIIISYEGEVKILDFGIAKAASKISKTEAGVLKGKFSYMSPEQASGKNITQTSDIYACGVILHELLTSERLFRSKTDMETLEKVKQGLVPPPSEKNPQIPAALDAITLKSLAKDQKSRYQTAGEFLHDLLKFSYESKLTYSSQDLSAFLQTLFSDVISQEKENLLSALEQVPAEVEPNLRNARTNVAFKRSTSAPKDPNRISELPKRKEDLTQTASKRESDSKRKQSRLAMISLLVAAFAGALYFLPKKEAPVVSEEPIPSLENVVIPTPDPNEKASPTFPNVPSPLDPPPPREAEFPDPKPLDPRLGSSAKEPDSPKPEAPQESPNESAKNSTPKNSKVVKESKVAETTRTTPKTRKPAPRSSPKRSPERKAETTPIKPVEKGVIDVIAPSGSFANLFINGAAIGTVPGPKARGIELPAGTHQIKCQSPARTFEGQIQITNAQRLRIRCDELKP